MSTTTDAPATDTTATAAAEAVETPDYETRVNQRAEKLHKQLAKKEAKKAPTERTPDTQLWKLARQAAKSEVRREIVAGKTKELAGKAARQARSELSSLRKRNAKQLAPWLLAAPYAGVGEAAALVADYSAGASPLGVAAATAGVGVAGSIAAWKRKVAGRVPPAFREKVQAGMALGTGWAAAMPFTAGPAEWGMWAALLAGTSWLGLSWWREHDHPIPLPDDIAATDLTEALDRSGTETDEQRRIQEIIDAWTGKVAPTLVPGSILAFHSGSTDAVLSFLITLDTDKRVTRNGVKQQIEQIAMKLGVFEDRLSFATTEHPAQLLMHVRESDPVFVFERPIVLCNGKPITSRWEVTPGATVDIAYGQYIDGSGYACVRFLESGSVNGAFLLGGMGSGKTRTAEVIAAGLRLLGCYILWIDGQNGASSPLLNDHADETFEFNMQEREDESGVREFTAAIADITAKRNRQLRNDPSLHGAYTYDPARPPVVGLMDEAHELFQTKHPTEGTYGHRLGAFASQVRKTGLSLIAISQDYDKAQTFGGSSRLREGLTTSGNLLGMRQTDRTRIGMLPDQCPPLSSVPGRGYGYLPLQDRPDTLWCTFNLGATPEEARATLEPWFSAYDRPVLEVTRTPEPVGATAPSVRGTGEVSGGAGAGRGPVRLLVGGDATASGVESESERRPVTDAEQRVLDTLAGGAHTPTSLGAELGMSSQAAGKHLHRLGAKGYVQMGVDGTYTVTD